LAAHVPRIRLAVLRVYHVARNADRRLIAHSQQSAHLSALGRRSTSFRIGDRCIGRWRTSASRTSAARVQVQLRRKTGRRTYSSAFCRGCHHWTISNLRRELPSLSSGSLGGNFGCEARSITLSSIRPPPPSACDWPPRTPANRKCCKQCGADQRHRTRLGHREDAQHRRELHEVVAGPVEVVGRSRRQGKRIVSPDQPIRRYWLR
jgi:hypothetical protein